MQALLSFDQAPPFAAPARFFLTAPLFAVLAGVLLALAGPDLLASRWGPATLAMTHLLTLGFMLQVMLGALIQILPVVAGANVRQPSRVAAWTHCGLIAGTLALSGGFLAGSPAFLQAGAALLAAAVLLFLLTAGRALFEVPSTSPTIRGLKLALCGLAGVTGLGLFLVVALHQGTSFSLLALTDLHAGWGFGAWSGVLLVAVAYVVVPMFQLTPGYPAWPAWWFPPAIVGLLLLWSLGVGSTADSLIRLGKGLLAIAGLAFCGLTLRLQAQRRRARIDATCRYWQFGLSAGIWACLMLLTAAIVPTLADLDPWPFLFATALIMGGLVSFIVGMLYKIVPFLAWLHLQNLGKGPAPTMNKLLAEAPVLAQFKAHVVSVLLLAGAAWQPGWLARPAGVALALSQLWLAYNLWGVLRRYRHLRNAMANA